MKALVSEMRFPIGPAGFRRLQDARTTLLDLKGASGRVAATAPHEESGGHTALPVLVRTSSDVEVVQRFCNPWLSGALGVAAELIAPAQMQERQGSDCAARPWTSSPSGAR